MCVNKQPSKLKFLLAWLPFGDQFFLFRETSLGTMATKMVATWRVDKEHKQWWWWQKLEWQKKQSVYMWIGKTTTFHVHHAFCTFLCSCCTTAMWNVLISHFIEDVNTGQWFSFSFCELRYSPLEFNSWKIGNIWQIRRFRIRVMKVEAAQIHSFGSCFHCRCHLHC